ncbi:hypothetical protein DPMN_130404 [Dreissena polymorpha]|uniref:Uncharacterized protein n=1 Tax=Dreissena polymorpha TaxID=45954 RepID=A0A9D4K1A8_DREPO|nr:hypothetical protein DPMN_130404 [Dreissena polymorpha]
MVVTEPLSSVGLEEFKKKFTEKDYTLEFLGSSGQLFMIYDQNPERSHLYQAVKTCRW